MRATSPSTSSRIIRCVSTQRRARRPSRAWSDAVDAPASRSCALGPEHHAREQVADAPRRGPPPPPCAARRKRWIRSRASGGTCGDSIAEPQRRDHVELASARDLDDARQIDLAQLDRRARQRAHHRGGVLRIGQQAHPGQHIAHLRPLGERRRSRVLARRRRPAASAGAIRDGHGPRIRAPGQGIGTLLGYVHDSWTRSIGTRAADRRADRRLAASIRRHAGAESVQPLAHDFAAARERLHGPGAPRGAAAAGDGRPAGVDRRQPADDAPAAGPAHRASGRWRRDHRRAVPGRCARRRAVCSARRWARSPACSPSGCSASTTSRCSTPR